MSAFATKYRISRDKVFTYRWAVQSKRWWWPFWIEEIGLLVTKSEAEDMIPILKGHRT